MMTKHIYYIVDTIINGMVQRNTLMISSLPLFEYVRGGIWVLSPFRKDKYGIKKRVNKSIKHRSAASFRKNVTIKDNFTVN